MAQLSNAPLDLCVQTQSDTVLLIGSEVHCPYIAQLLQVSHYLHIVFMYRYLCFFITQGMYLFPFATQPLYLVTSLCKITMIWKLIIICRCDTHMPFHFIFGTLFHSLSSYGTKKRHDECFVVWLFFTAMSVNI